MVFRSTLVLLFALSSGCASSGVRSLPVSAQEQASLTPATVIADLKAGNERFVRGQLSDPNVQARRAASRSGQYPKAVFLSCLDSRVPVEWVFDQGIGDLFVGRVAGNVETPEQIGSMEFAAKLAGVKLVVVLGHESCGAVKGACDGVQLGNLTGLLEEIQPAVAAVRSIPAGERSSQNAAFVEQVVEENVRRTVADIRAHSPTLAGMEDAGEIRIVGAIYSLQTGEVRWL